MARWSEADLPRLDARRALVTGGASGLGYETARALAMRGASVIIADRNTDGGLDAVRRIHALAPDAAVEFRALDLADLKGIQRFAEELNAAAPALDLIINNAGILPSLQRCQTRDGFELAFGIGHLGHFALTARLMPALLRSTAPRVVGVSSLVQAYAKIDFDDLQAERTYEPQRAYNQTKLAALMFSLELHHRATAAGLPLQSLAAHPGVARTSLGDSRMREPPRRLRDHAEAWAYRAMMRGFGQSPERGAWPLLHAAAMPGTRGGEFYGPDGFRQFSGTPAKVQPSRAAQDSLARQKLWQRSEELTGLRFALP